MHGNRGPTLDAIQFFYPHLTLLPNSPTLPFSRRDQWSPFLIHPFSGWLYSKLFKLLLNFRWVIPMISCWNFFLLESAYIRKGFEVCLVFMLRATIWAIWKERNRWIFRNFSGDPYFVRGFFLFLVASWAIKDNTPSRFSFECIRWNYEQSSFLMRMTLFSIEFLFADK